MAVACGVSKANVVLSATAADLAALGSIASILPVTEEFRVRHDRLARVMSLAVRDIGLVVGHAHHQARCLANAAVQLGKLAGARVIASASSEEKRAIALAAGADTTIDSGDPAWRKRIDALTGGRGVDVVYDPVGGPGTERAFRALAWDGRLLVVGFAAGSIPSIAANLALMKGASLVGANLLQGLKYEPDHCAREARRLIDLFGQGRLSVPPVAHRYPLKALDAALAEAATGRTAGRIVITVGE